MTQIKIRALTIPNIDAHMVANGVFTCVPVQFPVTTTGDIVLHASSHRLPLDKISKIEAQGIDVLHDVLHCPKQSLREFLPSPYSNLDFPVSRPVAIVNLSECFRYDEAYLRGMTELEKLSGTWIPSGGYAVKLTDIQPLTTTLECMGKRGVWPMVLSNKQFQQLCSPDTVTDRVLRMADNFVESPKYGAV